MSDASETITDSSRAPKDASQSAAKSGFLSTTTQMPSQNGTGSPVADCMSPMGSMATPNPFVSRYTSSFDVKEYFVGPRDTLRHSKWPLVLQMRGSITPEMVLPLLFVAAWTTAVTVFSYNVHNIGVSSVLTTITGFVVGLGLSFRSATAYERYNEGRKYWAQVLQATQGLGRLLWIQGRQVPAGDPREILLCRISCLNMLLAFAVALKHKLRFEPYTSYEDLSILVGHMPSFAQAATAASPQDAILPGIGGFAAFCQYLGISFAYENPRMTIKKANHALGNLPLEILNHLTSHFERMAVDGYYPTPPLQALGYTNISLLNDAMVGTERILSTPLPIAYSIAINQITWVYIVLLPFQLLPLLGWITIPATVAAAYIILGILLIGAEIENPFGNDTNDLPLDTYCEQIATELDIIASHNSAAALECIQSDENKPLYPISTASYRAWLAASEDRIRATIKAKHTTIFSAKARVGHAKDEKGEKMV